jgi:hypothetical protein
MQSTSPGAPGAGTEGRTGAVAGGKGEQGLLDLTLAEDPSSKVHTAREAGREPDREWGPEAGSGCCGRCGCGAEDMAVELSVLTERLAAWESSAEQLARVDRALAERAEEARSVVQLMEEVLDASVGAAEQARQAPEAALAAMDGKLAELAATAAKLRQEAVATLVGKAEEIGALAERSAGNSAARVEAEARRVATACEDVLAEFRDARRFVRWAAWVLVGASAVMVVLALTLLRPGWTMSAEQRRALRVGETVIRTYAEASERERVEIRRVMHWPAPEAGDSARLQRAR